MLLVGLQPLSSAASRVGSLRWVLMNIILGIVGAVLAIFLLGLFGVALGGWIGYLIAGFIGACILIAIARALVAARPCSRRNLSLFS